MKRIFINKHDRCSLIDLGRQGENGVRQIIYDGYPEDGFSVNVYVQRPNDAVAYPANQVELDADSQTIIWTVTNIDTDKAGQGSVQYVYTDQDGTVAKTKTFSTHVGVSLDIGSEAPDAYLPWTEQILARLVTAEDTVDNILGIIAPEYNESDTYYYGQVVRHEESLYAYLNQSSEITGTFDPTAWTQVTVAWLLGGLLEAFRIVTTILNRLESNIAESIAQEFNEESAYAVGDYVMFESRLYKCIVPKDAGGTFEAFRFEAVNIIDIITGE